MANLRIPIDLDVLKSSGITPPKLLDLIKPLGTHIGQPFLQHIEKNGIKDIGTLTLLHERSALVNEVSTKPGFKKVIKSITSEHEWSLTEPKGSWFELIVGYLTIKAGEEPFFEQKIAGIPKDILLRSNSIHIECKSFLTAATIKEIYTEHKEVFEAIKKIYPEGTWHVQVTRDITDGKALNDLIGIFKSNSTETLKDYTNDSLKITITQTENIKPTGKWKHGETLGLFGVEFPTDTLRRPFQIISDGYLSIHFSGPHFDQYHRFENSIIEKYRQMVEGLCNLIAIDTNDFTGDIEELTRKLSGFILTAENPKISGLLLINRRAEKKEIVLTLNLIKNPYGIVKIPEDFAKAIIGQYKIVC